MRHYCTLYDKNYLPFGLSLWESLLQKSSEPFVLHILALDKEAAERTIDLTGINDLQKNTVKVYELDQLLIEDWPLAEAKKTKPYRDFCWMLASYWLWYLLKTPLPEVTYLDSDLYFFQDPEEVHD